MIFNIMAYRRLGDKLLFEPMPTRFTDAYICGTREKWVKRLYGQLGTYKKKMTQRNNIEIHCMDGMLPVVNGNKRK